MAIGCALEYVEIQMSGTHPPNKFISGSRLIKNAYDGNGLLLLQEGTVIDETTDVDRLKQKDVQFHPGGRACPTQTQATAHASDTEQASIHTSQELVKQRNEEAKAIKADATKAVASVFNRVTANGNVDVEEVMEVITPLIADLTEDSRALLSLVNLKNADSYTYTHSVNVAILTTTLAIRSGHSERLEETGIGALMHDVGKTQIPLDILKKPTALNSSELAVMRQHPLTGANTLVKSGGFSPWAINIAMDHHETVCGTGYPRAKRGHEINLAAQMTSIADVYDALTTDRPYRAALSPKLALELMTKKLAKSFNPSLLCTFVSLVGYYPVGTTVELNNGCKATVITTNPDNAAAPAIVEVTRTSDGQPVAQPYYVDMRSQKLVTIQPTVDENSVDHLSPLITHEIHPFRASA